MVRLLGLCFLVAGVLPRSVLAEAAPSTLAELVRGADVIAVGTVESVAGPKENSLSAEIRMDKVLKGGIKSGETLHVSLAPTWTCDDSWAEESERGLYFLSFDGLQAVVRQGRWNQGRNAGRVATYRIARSGHGRLVILDWQGEQALKSVVSFSGPKDLLLKQGHKEQNFYGDVYQRKGVLAQVRALISSRR